MCVFYMCVVYARKYVSVWTIAHTGRGQDIQVSPANALHLTALSQGSFTKFTFSSR